MYYMRACTQNMCESVQAKYVQVCAYIMCGKCVSVLGKCVSVRGKCVSERVKKYAHAMYAHAMYAHAMYAHAMYVRV